MLFNYMLKSPISFGSPYLLIELFYIGMPVVRTDEARESSATNKLVETCKCEKQEKSLNEKHRCDSIGEPN